MKWRLVNIPEVLFFQEGPGVRKWQFTDSGVKLLNVGNLNDNQLNLSTTSIYISNEEAFGKYSHFLVEEGDLLIGCSGIVVDKFHQKMAFAQKSDLPLCMNTSTMRFRCLDERLDIRFFMYVLQSKIFTNQLRKLITGSAQLNFGPSHIKQIQIPLPPLPVQQKIAAILDAADAYRQKTKALIEKYDQLAQSLFLEMFGDPVKNEKGWEVTTIRNVVREVKYGTSAKAGDTGSFPYLRMNNITYEGYMDYSDLKYIDVRDEEKPKFSVKRGDILFNRTNSKDLVGKTGLITTDSEMIIAGYLIRVRVNTDMNPYFVWGHLNSNWAKLILKNMCKNIIGMANINAQELQEIKILKPPRDIQDLFAKCIDKLFDQKTILSKNLEKTNQLFQSLLQKAFNGDLVS